MPSRLAVLEMEFLNGTRYRVKTDFVSFSQDVCWVFLTDTNSTDLCRQNRCEDFNGYVNQFTQNNFNITVSHDDMTLSLHSPLARSRMADIRLGDYRMLADTVLFIFNYDEVHMRDCTAEGKISCREYSPGNPLAPLGNSLDMVDWTCPLGMIHPLTAQVTSRVTCDTNAACLNVAGILYAARHLGCMPMMEQSYTSTPDELQVFARLGLMPCPINDSEVNAGAADEMFRFIAKLDEGQLCPKECTQLVYRFNMFKLKNPGKRPWEHWHEVAVELLRSYTPSLSLRYVPRVTNMQFYCNAAAIFGIWYGLSVLSVWKSAVDPLTSRLKSRLWRMMTMKVKPKPSPINLTIHQSVVALMNQNHNNNNNGSTLFADYAARINPNHESRASDMNTTGRYGDMTDKPLSFNRYGKY